MANRLHLRPLSEEEELRLRRLAASRTAPVRLVQRARLLQAMLDHPEWSALEAGRSVGYTSAESACRWVHRFNEGGLDALDDLHRSGRRPQHDETVRSRLVSLALQKPSSLGYPFALWTLERLQRAFQEREGIHLVTSTIWEYIEAEGLRWKRQESWFHEALRHDEEFVEKRGPSWQPTFCLRPEHA
jgi:transposase